MTLARGVVAAALLLGCNVTAASTTGGADLPERGDCPRGLAVVSSDFQSSEIALLDPTGAVKSSAFLSSASTVATDLAAPLSGDIGVAAARSRPGELVVIDRMGTNVLTFVDTKTAVVRAQLPIGTGFEANPQDYLELNEHQALVPRLGENASPGHQPFDAGSDLLVVDPSVPAIIDSWSLPRKDGYLPSPAAVTALRGSLLVTLQHMRANFSGMAEGELVAIATADQRLQYRLPLSGLKNCGRAQLSPSGDVLAVACSAFVDRKGAVAEPQNSGLVLLDARAEPPVELVRFAALDLAQGPIQASVEFVNERVVLFKTQTAQDADRDNQLFSLALATGEATLLATAARGDSGLGLGIAFGGMSCGATCGDPCFVADRSRGKLLRFRVHGGALTADADAALDGAGLPPADVTPFW